jgi:hypothetical protein
MSSYEIPYVPPIGYTLPLPIPIGSSWRPTGPPAPSTEHSLQQPFDQWSRPDLGQPPYPTTSTYESNRITIPMQQQHQQHPLSIPQTQGGWGLPKGGVIHVPPGIPDEMLPRQFAPGSELVKVTGKVSEFFRLISKFPGEIASISSLFYSPAQVVELAK